MKIFLQILDCCIVKWQWEEQDDPSEDDEELPPKLILEERNPWLTPTESCVSDETEEEEEKLKRASPGCLNCTLGVQDC